MMEWLTVPLLNGSTVWMAAAASAVFAGLLVILWSLLQWIVLRRVHLFPIERQLQEATSLLADTPSDPIAFAKHYPQINRRMAGTAPLSKIWEGYCANLIFSQGDGPVMSSRPAQHVMQTAALTDGKVDRRFYQAMPGYLMATGLLFTFVGLMVTLLSSGQEMTSLDTGDAKHAIRQLLIMASLQFLPAVLGMLSAGWFSLRLKRQMYRLDQALSQWCRLLDERIIIVTYEQLIYSQLLEAKVQTRRLAQLTNQLDRQVTVFDEQGSFQVASQPPMETVLRMPANTNSGDEMARVMEQSLDRFLLQLREQNRIQTNPMVDNVEKFSLAIRNMGGMVQSFHQQIGELRAACQQSARELHSLSTPFAEVAELLKSTASQVQDSHASMAQVAKQFPATVAVMTDASRQTQEMLTSYQDRMQHMEGMLTILADIRTDVAAFPDLVAEYMAKKANLSAQKTVLEEKSAFEGEELS
ncbi:MAG: hypothetical protein G8345_16480 [Magnetococcales bacterium]|nr:hypothetical protein [Magnetococcales bacterium]NGZ28473.1 hypothetical protein [Magnetococcales bacterium]